MITPYQHKAYLFIKEFIQENGFAPSLMEIAKGIGVKSKSLISRYIHTLKEAGLIDLEEGKRRHIRLKPKQHTNGIPFMGYIAAGLPIEAISENETLNIVDLLASTPKIGHYALKVKGDSMIEDGIFDGDIILCESRNFARNGEIIVALIDNHEATLKRITHRHDGKIVLTPANAKHKPQIYAANRVQIQGAFIGLIRLNK